MGQLDYDVRTGKQIVYERDITDADRWAFVRDVLAYSFSVNPITEQRDWALARGNFSGKTFTEAIDAAIIAASTERADSLNRLNSRGTRREEHSEK